MKHKILCVLTVIAALALSFLRAWQYLWIIDVPTGFFTESNNTIPCLYGTIIAVSLLAAVFVFFDKNFAQRCSLPTRGRVLGVVLLAAGFLNIVTLVYSFASDITANNIEVKTLLTAVLGLFASIVLLFWGVSLTSGKSITGSGRLLLPLIPTAWVTVRLIQTFMHNNTILPISENLLILLSLVAMTVFFLYFAFAVAGLDTKISKQWLFVSALIGFVLISANTLGMIVASFGHAFYQLDSLWYLSKLADLSLAVLMICTAFYIAFGKGSETTVFAAPEVTKTEIE